MAWPTRTGLPTMKLAAKAIQKLATKYSEVHAAILTVDQLAKIANLIDCIVEFLSDVPAHDPTEE